MSCSIIAAALSAVSCRGAGGGIRGVTGRGVHSFRPGSFPGRGRSA